MGRMRYMTKQQRLDVGMHERPKKLEAPQCPCETRLGTNAEAVMRRQSTLPVVKRVPSGLRLAD